MCVFFNPERMFFSCLRSFLEKVLFCMVTQNRVSHRRESEKQRGRPLAPALSGETRTVKDDVPERDGTDRGERKMAAKWSKMKKNMLKSKKNTLFQGVKMIFFSKTS